MYDPEWMYGESPNCLESERAVLDACLISPREFANVREILQPEDFYEELYSKLYEVMLEMHADGEPVDFVTIQIGLQKRDLFNRLGGQSLLASLMATDMVLLTTRYHAERVKEFSMRRKMIMAGDAIKLMARDIRVLSPDLLIGAEAEILRATQGMNVSSFVSIQELSPAVIEKITENYQSDENINKGYMSNFTDLDSILLGFQPGSLNIIAARPSMGKTALALNIAQFGGKNDSCVLMFSLEMSSEQLIYRMLSAESAVPMSTIISGAMDKTDYYNVIAANEVLQSRKIYINEGSQLSAVDFRERCRRFKIQHSKLSLIVVDYLQLMVSGTRRNENRQYEMAEISRMMKSVAVELECPVIALSQLSRDTEKRTDKKPQLSDLRDSGAIEQDADVVLMLYREDYYSENENNNLTDSTADIRIAKNRNGATGVCQLIFQREITRFRNRGFEG